MQFITPLTTGALLAVFTFVLARLGKTRADRIEAELKEFRTEVRSEFAQVRSEFGQFRTEVQSEFAQVRLEMAVMRSDLTRVALAFGVQPRPETG